MTIPKEKMAYVEKNKPIMVYNPAGLLDIELLERVIDANAIGLISLERLSGSEARTLLNNCTNKLSGTWGVRINSKDDLQLILSHLTISGPDIVIVGDMQLTKKEVTSIQQKRKILLLAEVVSLQEAYDKRWADAFLVKGHEAAGRIGDETSLILAQQFADAALPFILQGGIGFYTISGAFAAGAKAVVLDTQVYLAKDSPLPEETKTFLQKIDATDTKVLGDTTKKKYRVFAKLGTKIVRDFIKQEKQWLSLSCDERTAKIVETIRSQREMFDRPSINNCLLPIGQDIAFASYLSGKFSTIEGIITGLIQQAEKQLQEAKKEFPFRASSPLAKDLGTTYPIIQGPMANVSENALFAKKIAEEGALPFLALGSLFPNQTKTLITETKKELGSLPFGCGIIGLEANKTARDTHLEIIKELQPEYVVVAAGTINQAKQVMSYGPTTFLHTPSHLLFTEAIQAGVDHLVLEGFECGGHIGILTSFVLWELALEQLENLQKTLLRENRKITVAFAGGIGNRYSAAIVAAIAAGQKEIMKAALWIGSAYLLTKEIVDTKAIKPKYQELALNAQETIVLGETVNTRARSIPTPFANEIVKRELERLEQGMKLSDRKHKFERDNLGATRIAALGMIWNPEGEDDKPNRFMPVDEEAQYEKGNYLIGQIVASLRNVRSIKSLHQELTVEAKNVLMNKEEIFLDRLQKLAQIDSAPEITDHSPLSSTFTEGEGVAIVGLGGIFPDAPDIPTFWENIKKGVYSIKELPENRWLGDTELFYDEDPTTPDKSYTKIAATVDNFDFNSLEFKIPPNVAKSIDKVQKFALVAAKEALIDAGLLDENVDNSRTAVICGNAMGGESQIHYTRRIFLDDFYAKLETTSAFQGINKELWDKIRDETTKKFDRILPKITEDSMPGELSNVIAGRIANVFNLRGKNMTCDAACASSLAALNVAINSLLDKECDAVLCGGSDVSLDIATFVKFSKIGALSSTGSYPFDARASGFVMGEGAGFVVLKRLSDAIEAGDRIYAVIRGFGASSDGKGKGITAPNPLGQKLAIQRALEQAAIDIQDVQFIEAHGTSTRVGDVVEMEVLHDLTKGKVKPETIALGSVKSQIGHLKSAAGIASIIKTALALHHKVLPPSINFSTPNPKIDWEESPFYVNTKLKQWNIANNKNRIAGVSSFGFGGTNYHTILEEYQPGKTKGYLPKLLAPNEIRQLIEKVNSSSINNITTELVLDQKAWDNYYEEHQTLETDAIFIGGNSKEEALTNLLELKEKIPTNEFSKKASGTRIKDFAVTTHRHLKQPWRIGLTCSSFEGFSDKITEAIAGLKDPVKRSFLRNKGIFYSEDHAIGKIAFIFPGQGSQYVHMGKKLWEKFAIVRETFEEANKITKELIGINISEVIFALDKDEQEAKDMLIQTEITQPAIFTVNIALFRLLQSFGIQPDFVAGHSLGEFAALVAAGILSFRDGMLAVVPRGKAMAKFDSKDKGMMAFVAADHQTVESLLSEIDGYVIPANKNSPKQTVISGETPAIEQAIEIITTKGITCFPIPVSAAFHSQLIALAVPDFRKAIEQLTFHKPTIPISSNVTGKLYPKTREEIIDLLCEQIVSPVEWIKQIETMYKEYDVRTFIEVGPKYVLTHFVNSILEDESDYIALATNHPKKGTMQHFYEVIAALGAYSYPLIMPEKNSSLYTNEFLDPVQPFYQHKKVIQPKIIPKLDEPKLKENYSSVFTELQTKELSPLLNEPAFKDYLQLQAPAISAFLKTGYQTYKESIEEAIKSSEKLKRLNISTEGIGITGISIGLPGKDRQVFDESNFEAILAGMNFIDPVPEHLQKKMVNKNIVRLVKDEIKGAQFQTISDINEVIHLAAQKGQFDLTKEYGVKKEFAEIFDITFKLAFAAGIEALKNAGIPLMPMKVKTTTGKEISKGWVLPESIRDETGIIFASAFPAYSNFADTISRHLSDKYEHATKQQIESLFDELIAQIQHKRTKESLTRWFKENKKQITLKKESKYQFSRKFLFEILNMGHAQFAQFIGARGPNTTVNAACASTTQAIAIAEDWIRTSRCRRVIIVAADDPTNDEMMEWIGSGFLAVGAATTSDKIEEAALPFDKRRHGMIIGMGAVGIILESESAMEQRGVKPIVDLLGSHFVNSAFHGTRLDRDHISTQMDNFLSTIEQRHDISRDEIAKELVFVSHETYTPARGGSASAEVDALRKGFGPMSDNIVIANTKGFTGHAMGAGIEDVVAIKILETGIVPPIANFKETDPELGYLNLSKGGEYDVKYALRFAAGFGSQLSLALFRVNTQKDRFASPAYDNWLASLGGSKQTMEISKKTLRMREDPTIAKKKTTLQRKPSAIVTADKVIIKSIIDLLADKTGYPKDMLEPDMHLEEDLGIDTVKQAELFGILRAKYNLPREEGVRIQDYYSVNKIAEYVSSRVNPSNKKQSTKESSTFASDSEQKIIQQITKLIADKTGYPTDMIEPDMELEEDLGIDTVKQAEMFGLLRAEYALPREEGIRIQDYSTVNKIADYVTERIKLGRKESESSAQSTIQKEELEILPAKRYIVKPAKTTIEKIINLKIANKRFLLISDNSTFAKKIAQLLQEKDAVIIKHLTFNSYEEPLHLKQHLPEEKIDGLLFVEPQEIKQKQEDHIIQSYFVLTRYLSFNEKSFIAAIHPKADLFGWRQPSKQALCGAITGYTKALARELAGSIVKTIATDEPRLVVDELIGGDASVEVAYNRKGKRYIFAVQEENLKAKKEESFKLTKEDLIVVSGGAQGITYEIVAKIASNYQPKMALLGRTTLPNNINELVAMDDKALAQEKEQLITKLQQNNERLTPVMIEKEWSKITKAIAVQKALNHLRSLGSKVEYYSVDVVNSSKIRQTMEKIREDFQSGITGLIHAAGIEQSKLLKNKELADFARIYNVKVRGFTNLLENIEQKQLRFVICFSSVAGRFGNAGQVDYSAANDYLSKKCWSLRNNGLHATSICWSAWADVGMATRGSVLKVLQMGGVTPIGTDDGIQAFMDELAFGQSAEVVIAGKLGILLNSPLPSVKVDKKYYPLLEQIKRNYDGSLQIEKELALDKDLYLEHHRLNQVPVFPGVMGLELFAQMAKMAYPNKRIKQFKDIAFESAIKLLKDQPVTIKAKLFKHNGTLQAMLFSEFIKDGKVLGKPRIHFKSTIILGRRYNTTSTEITPASALVTKEAIYDILPHGPRFQVLESLDSASNNIVLGKCSKLPNKQFNWSTKELLSQPLTLESAFQAVGLTDIIRDNRMGLPYKLAEIKYHAFTGNPKYIQGRKLAETDIGTSYDFDVISDKKEIILSVKNYQTAKVDLNINTDLVEKIRLERIKSLFNVPQEAILEANNVNEIYVKIANDSGNLQKILHKKELAKLANITIEKRKKEWLAGVIAAKKALKQFKPSLDVSKIAIQKDTLGKPFVVLNKKTIHISITHSNGYAVAVISPEKPLGIDLEKITKRSEALIDELLSPKEQHYLKENKKAIANELITKIWTAKEAAAKAMGTGLNIDLHDLQITDITDQRILLAIAKDKIPQSAKKNIRQSKGKKVQLSAELKNNDEYIGALCRYDS